MKKPILDRSSNNGSSNSSDDTDSTQTQCSIVLPPIRNSNTFDNLVNKNRINNFTSATATVPTVATAAQDPRQLHTQSPFRKCQSFIHLSKTSDRLQSSLIDCSGNCDRLRKATSTPTAIYMAYIKQEPHLFVHRIFNRCKVNLI